MSEVETAADVPFAREIEAYVDDELPIARRIAVEAYLSTRPELAARVIADLRLRDELRFAFAASPTPVPAATVVAARRLEAGLGRAVLLRRLRAVAAAALFIGVGWLAHSEFRAIGVGPVAASAAAPGYLAEAVAAHRTIGERGAGAAAAFDPAAIRAATGIALPPLPEGWHVADARILPSDLGPTVEIAVDAGAGRRLSLFAVRPGGFDVVPATHAERDGLTASYWQIGEVAYAVVADPAGGIEVDRIGETLARTLY